MPRRRILAIEDMAEFVDVLRVILPTDRIDSEPTLASGMSRLWNSTYDIVLVDLTLHDSSMEQTLAAWPDIRKLAEAGKSRMIIVTGTHNVAAPDADTTVITKGSPRFVEDLLEALR